MRSATSLLSTIHFLSNRRNGWRRGKRKKRGEKKNERHNGRCLLFSTTIEILLRKGGTKPSHFLLLRIFCDWHNEIGKRKGRGGEKKGREKRRPHAGAVFLTIYSYDANGQRNSRGKGGRRKKFKLPNKVHPLVLGREGRTVMRFSLLREYRWRSKGERGRGSESGIGILTSSSSSPKGEGEKGGRGEKGGGGDGAGGVITLKDYWKKERREEGKEPIFLRSFRPTALRVKREKERGRGERKGNISQTNTEKKSIYSLFHSIKSRIGKGKRGGGGKNIVGRALLPIPLRSSHRGERGEEGKGKETGASCTFSPSPT